MNFTANHQVKDTERQLQNLQHLKNVIHTIHTTNNLDALVSKIQDELRQLLNAERFTVYVYHHSKSKPLVSKFLVGTELKEVALSLSTSSIAGYVGLSQRTLLIKDAYDQAELHSIHPDLQSDHSFDRRDGDKSRSMMVIPIKANQVMLGVFQVINCTCDDVFTADDLQKATMVTSLLGHKFQIAFGGTSGPFEYLVRTGHLNKKQLELISIRAKKLKRSIAHLLITEENFSNEEVGKSLESYYQIPYQSYDPELHVRHDLIKHINKTYLYKNNWVPVFNDQNQLWILIDDPTDSIRIMELQQLLGIKEYNFKVSTVEEIHQFIDVAFLCNQQSDVDDLVTELETEEVDTETQEADIITGVEDEPVNDEAPTIIRLVNQIILDAINARASDIHIEPGCGKQPSIVRFRVDGICVQTLTFPPTHQRAVISRIKIISNLDISEHRMSQDGKCMIRNKGKSVELRVATIPTVNGESVVLRILSGSKTLPLGKLNLSAWNLKEIKKLISRPHGIFLVVGPTGSGKTTTLHAVLGHINTPERKIWTAEDPVEITQEGLQQVQINHKTGMTFASALRSFLRADPDVIMIGEMRDQETAHSGIEASLTGHLVFSTLHTNSASGTIVRLLDLGMDPINFSDALLGVLAQRLVRTLCKQCKRKEAATASEIALLREYYGEQAFEQLDIDIEQLNLYHPVGCKACGDTGYHGRTGIYELLVSTSKIQELIYKRASAAEIQSQSEKQGTCSLMQDGIQKVLAGQTDLEQIKRVAAS